MGSDAGADGPALAWVADVTGGEVVATAPFPAATSSTVLAVDVRTAAGVRPLVLRRYTNAAWLAEEPDVPGEEVAALRIAAAADVPTPRVVALERDAGAEPWLLMTRLPGAPRPPSADDAFLAPIAALLPRIHAAPLPSLDALRPYDPWELEASGPPPWTREPKLWHAAFARFAAPPPPLPPSGPVLLHRDFHPGNVLWHDGAISGVVDWPTASIGHPHADVGHCRMDLSRTVGLHAADRFLELTGIAPGAYDPYWDFAAVLGGFTEDDWEPADEALVRQAVARAGRGAGGTAA